MRALERIRSRSSDRGWLHLVSSGSVVAR